MTEAGLDRIQPGIYRHYKGKQYHVMGQATHSETMESMVIYRALYGEYQLWIRPSVMFSETVRFEGREVPRFALEVKLNC
ncbi:hypothetical protein SRRS_50300 [Sporomusa rhizae]|uniref:DUF1653 domain-containing protein n=1 Tax=Sporomusa rhizae TaxID=357999 RepID=UPI00352A55BE